MSQKERVTVACPQCGCSQPATVWYSLNVSVDPDDKKALLDGEINRFHCRECNASASLETPFMYHDMDREFVVQYLPPALLHDPNLPQRFDQNGAQRVPDSVLAQMPEYMRRPHLVLSMEELVRYVVFRDRFPVTRTRDPG